MAERKKTAVKKSAATVAPSTRQAAGAAKTSKVAGTQGTTQAKQAATGAKKEAAARAGVATPALRSRAKPSARGQTGMPAACTELEFAGFPSDGLAFLAELRVNNDRDWFKASQTRYEQMVRQPALAFIRAMAPHLAQLSPHFVASDKRVGGSLMRPQRDTRFGTNKDPYKTNIGIQFRHTVGKDVHAPGFYFHIDPDEVFVGVGIWHPEPEPLRLVRRSIADKPKAYQAAVESPAFKRHFRLGGETLTRPPKGFDADHPLIDALKRKDHIAVANLKHSALTSPKLVKQVAEHFESASPFMRFLNEALGLVY